MIYFIGTQLLSVHIGQNYLINSVMNFKHRFIIAVFAIPIITIATFSAEVFVGKQAGSVEIASAYAADPALLESFKSILAKWNNIILNSRIVTPQKQTASVIETGPTYYVATNGLDSNSGTVSAPFATIQKAHDVAVPGDTIYVRGGTYNISKGIDFTRGGSSGKPIKLFAYPGEVPVLNASGIATVDTWVIKLRSGASWWHIKGLEIKNNPNGGGITLINSTNNNIIENNNIHHNGFKSEWAASGISVYDSPSNNLFLNNDLHNNQDIDNGDADGISAGNLGTGNVYRGNRMWQNSDDGIDFFCPSYSSNQTCGTVLLENNWSFENGYNEKHEALGNGNGFKLGGARPGLNNKSGGHTLKNNLTWGNLEGGYDDNNSNATLGNALPNTLYNNTAWNNGQNYVFWADVNHTLRNNINFGTLGHIYGSATNNSWTLPVTVNASDFSSIDDSCAKGPRQSDGSLPDCPFLKLISGSDLIDKGTNVGIPYSATAPDLGAFEYQIASTPTPAPTPAPVPAQSYSTAVGPQPIKPTSLALGTIFAGPNGSGTTCTEAKPCDIWTASSKAKAGDVVFLLGGTYQINKNLSFNNQGTASNPVIYESYPGQKAVFDGGTLTKGLWIEVLVEGKFIQVRNIDVRNMPRTGVSILGTDNILDGMSVYNNSWSGFSIYSSDNSTPDSTKGSRNTISNCIAHDNSDAGLTHSGFNDGNNADGISLHSGVDNRVEHCLVYHNSDDGIDTWMSVAAYVGYSISHSNGIASGDGNGIKAGGNAPSTDSYVEHNLSYSNTRRGLDTNGGKNVTFINNTTWNNASRGTFESDTILKNNISAETIVWGSTPIQTNNSWQRSGTLQFISTNSSSPDFLRPIVGGGFEDIGVYSAGSGTIQNPLPAPTPTPTDPNVIYPDVIISSLNYDQTTGKFSVVVKNQGTKSVASGVTIGVGYHVDGKQQTWGDVLGPLEAGGSVTIGTKGATYAIPAGTHSIMAWVDDANRFVESNETNNQLIKLVTISTSGTTPVPTSTTTAQVPTSPTSTSTTILNIFTENFETALLWTKSSPVTWYTGSPKNGKYSVRLQKTGSITKTISTVGYKNIKVTFNIGANSLDNNNERLEVLYYDGSSWTLLTSIKNGNENENNKLNPYLIALPTSVSDNPNFALRFKMVGSSTNDYGYVDDITVTGVK